MFADSLPDVFGNHLFQSWLNAQGKPIQLNALEQLAYVGQRGMGAWEYEPAITMDAPSSFRIAEMAQLLSEILAEKESLTPENANLDNLLKLAYHFDLLNEIHAGLQKIGTKPSGIKIPSLY